MIYTEQSGFLFLLLTELFYWERLVGELPITCNNFQTWFQLELAFGAEYAILI